MNKLSFKTTSGTMYTVDLDNRTIQGGQLKEPTPYLNHQNGMYFMMGDRPNFEIVFNGQRTNFVTSTIEKIYDSRSIENQMNPEPKIYKPESEMPTL